MSKILLSSIKNVPNRMYKFKIGMNKLKCEELLKMSKFNYMEMKTKDKFSLEEVRLIINNVVSKTFRDISKLPKEFNKLSVSEKLVCLEKPTEPEEYECCGKGCNPCVWDKYDTKLKEFEEAIQDIYTKVNEDG